MEDIKKDPFEEYIKQAEPSGKELGYAWYTAMGLLDIRETTEFPELSVSEMRGGVWNY